MTLRQKQSEFVMMLGELILYAYANGWELTPGSAYVPEDTYQIQEDGSLKRLHMVNSLHHLRLAMDLNLFKDGKYLTKTEDHRPLGEFWKTLGGSWGGDFGDGNHYSLEHKGVR